MYVAVLYFFSLVLYANISVIVGCILYIYTHANGINNGRK